MRRGHEEGRRGAEERQGRWEGEGLEGERGAEGKGAQGEEGRAQKRRPGGPALTLAGTSRRPGRPRGAAGGKGPSALIAAHSAGPALRAARAQRRGPARAS